MSGGGGAQTVKTEPPAFQLPFLQQLLSGAGQAFGGGQLGQVAGFDPAQIAGQQGLMNFAGGRGGEFATGVMDAFTNFLANAGNVEANPALQGFLEAAIRPVERQLTEGLLPAIRGGAQGAGQVGSSRQGIAEGLAIGRGQETTGDITSRIINQAFQTGQESLARGFALAPTVFGLGTAPANIMEAVGGVRQLQAQRELDQPFNALQQFQQLIGGQFGGTTTQPGPESNKALSALGGAAAGASIGAKVGAGGGPIGAGWGAAIGALIGLI